MTTASTTSKLLLLIAFLAFASIGFPDAILGVAWPSIRTTFDRQLPDIGFILFSSATGYFLSSAFAGKGIELFGVGRLLALSSFLVALGLFGFSITPGFWPFMLAAVIIGLGSGAVDAGLNFYAAEHFSVTVMNWLHAFFGIGAMLGPFIMAGIFAAGGVWRIGYVIVASAILLMAIVFVSTASQWNDGSPHTVNDPAPRLPVNLVLRMPMVRLQIVIFFVMCGIEATAGAWTATILFEKFDLGRSSAGIWTGLFWGSMAAGRLVLAPLARELNPARLVQFGSLGLLVGALMMTRDQRLLFQVGLLIFGLSMAPMFPTLMSLTPVRLGSQVSLHSIGFQVSAATVGVAIIPTLAGLLAARTTLTAIPWVMTLGAAAVILLETLLRIRTGHSVSEATPVI